MEQPFSNFIIAEAGVNHNGSLELAKKMIDAAVDAGVDAVKFQTFKAEKLVSHFAPKADYQLKNTDVSESQLDMIKKLELDLDSHYKLLDYCNYRGIQFLSTPFDIESLDLLVNNLKVSRLKIPSGEITNGLLLLKAAQTGKPIILSTGMSTLGEIETALGVLAFGYIFSDEEPSLIRFQEALSSKKGQAALREKVALLHCTTEYPVEFSDVNLRAMDTLKTAFGLQVGLSDHTQGISIPIAAVARGASIIEKHFTLDRNLPGPDHKASLEPEELKTMVTMIRQVELALGSGSKTLVPAELKNKMIARKSLVAGCNIKKGELFTETNLVIKRPGNGISPMYYWEWLGKTAPRNYEKDELVNP